MALIGPYATEAEALAACTDSDSSSSDDSCAGWYCCPETGQVVYVANCEEYAALSECGSDSSGDCSFPSPLYFTVSGNICGLCQDGFAGFAYELTESGPGWVAGSVGSGNPEGCAENQRGWGIKLTCNGDGTVSVSIPGPGSYCGPPPMIVTPTSWSPFVLSFNYNTSGTGYHCCDESGTSTVTVSISE